MATAAIARGAAEFPPGPRDWTPAPFLRGLREDTLGYLGALFARHGDAVGVRGGPVRFVALRRPEHARHVLIRNARNYWKVRQLAKLRPLAGEGVFERGEPRHAFAYLPFGLGGRRCIGEDFALLELRSVLARVLQRFRVSVDPAHTVVAKPRLTLKPRDGVRIAVEARA